MQLRKSPAFAPQEKVFSVTNDGRSPFRERGGAHNTLLSKYTSNIFICTRFFYVEP